MKNIVIGLVWLISITFVMLGMFEVIDVKGDEFFLFVYRLSLSYNVIACGTWVFQRRVVLDNYDLVLVVIAFVLGYVLNSLGLTTKNNFESTSDTELWIWGLMYFAITLVGSISAMTGMHRAIKVMGK